MRKLIPVCHGLWTSYLLMPHLRDFHNLLCRMLADSHITSSCIASYPHFNVQYTTPIVLGSISSCFGVKLIMLYCSWVQDQSLEYHLQVRWSRQIALREGTQRRGDLQPEKAGWFRHIRSSLFLLRLCRLGFPVHKFPRIRLPDKFGRVDGE